MSELLQEDKVEELLGLTSEIVAAHVSNNTVAVTDLPDLIERVYKTSRMSALSRSHAPTVPYQRSP